MSVWTRQQISQARGIRARAHVDQTLAARASGVLAATRQKMFKNMAHVGHSFAIELSPADVRYSEQEADHTIEIVSWWEPEVNAVEFRGGPRDGQRLEIPHPGEPIRVYQEPPLVLSHLDTSALAESIAEHIVVYDVAGWHEQGRYWVYETTH